MKCVTRDNVEKDEIFKSDKRDPCLFVFPGMSNFNGDKFPIEKWLFKAQKFNWYTMIDAAALASTSPIDLTKYKDSLIGIQLINNLLSFNI